MLLTGNIGKHGAGVYTWAGNYKGALLQASPWSGPGVGSLHRRGPVPPRPGREGADHPRAPAPHATTARTPPTGPAARRCWPSRRREGRKVFTGKTHLPTPTKAIWYNNANFLNQAKWVYNIIVNDLPKMDLIVDQQIEWTGSAEYADVVLPVNSWVEFQDLRDGRLVLQPVPPGLEGRDQAGPRLARRRRGLRRRGPGLADQTGDRRFADYFKFITEKKAKVYLQRVLDNCTTTRRRGRAVQGRSADGRRVRRRAGRGPDALPHLPARPVLGAGPRLDPVLHRLRPAGRLLRPPRGDRVRREPGRPSRGGRGHALLAQRDRLDQPVRPPQGLRHPARHDRPRPPPGAQRQDALGGGQEDGQSALGAGLPLLLLDAQEPALDALVVVHGRLALDLERQLRRPVPGRQAGTGRGGPPDPDEPRRGRRAGAARRGLRLRGRQPARPAVHRLGQGRRAVRGTRRSAAWCGSSSTRACPTTSRS